MSWINKHEEVIWYLLTLLDNKAMFSMNKWAELTVTVTQKIKMNSLTYYFTRNITDGWNSGRITKNHKMLLFKDIAHLLLYIIEKAM